MPHSNDAPARSGKEVGKDVKRVLAKLAQMNITVPAQALQVPPHQGLGLPHVRYTYLEHALMDWFEDRDIEQSQALIHFQPPRDEWHAISLLNAEKAPSNLSHDMLCPTLVDAIAAIIDAYDRDTARIDGWRREAGAVIAFADGVDVVRIDPVRYEPFNQAVRDRVRSAMKGVRRLDRAAAVQQLVRLPGFKACVPTEDATDGRPDGCMLLGFPTNWAFAMRSALEQVGISVKQSQAQELVAVYFGASDWHQLTSHQNEANDRTPPVALMIDDPDGRKVSYFRTPEEGLFALGKLLEAQTEPLVLQYLSTSLSNDNVICMVAKESAMQALPIEQQYLCPSWISLGASDYWSIDDCASRDLADAVAPVLESLANSDITPPAAEHLYGRGDRGLLESILGRAGIPPSQIIYVGSHALAVAYVPEPDGGPRLAARLQIFAITPQGPKPIEGGEIAMYKAETRVFQDAKGFTLEIRGDYGSQPPVRITAAHLGQLRQLKALTHPAGIFTYESFEIPDDVSEGAVH